MLLLWTRFRVVLELNAFEPIVFYCMFQSIDTLAYAVHTFVENCVTGITANETRCRYLVENSVGTIRGTMDILNKTL